MMNEMECLSCHRWYDEYGGGTCNDCHQYACEVEEALKLDIEELKAKVNFLSDHQPCFTDVLLEVAFDRDSDRHVIDYIPIPANREVLASRSPVFRAMLETRMKESLSGTIKISDASYDSLRAFVNYLYTAEACLDDEMAYDLLVLANKYEVKHLKTYCEKFLISKLNWESSLSSYSFAHQHNANNLLDASLSLILDNMEKVSKREEYMELVQKDPRLLVAIYEAYMSKQITAADGPLQ